MARAPTRNLEANRWTAFVHTINFDAAYSEWLGVNPFFEMDIRTSYDVTGDPAIHLENADPVSDGINYTIEGGLLTAVIRIAQATMSDQANLAFAAVRGDDNPLYYDLTATPEGGDTRVVMRGKFIVIAGATQ